MKKVFQEKLLDGTITVQSEYTTPKAQYVEGMSSWGNS